MVSKRSTRANVELPHTQSQHRFTVLRTSATLARQGKSGNGNEVAHASVPAGQIGVHPTVAEFIGLSPNTDFTESKLESAIISNLQRFLLELGKGFSYVTRQKLVRTEKKDYFIDLVFYNYLLKCFVLIDLKTNPITHQDVGQMDMYVRMYDERIRGEGDNPTIGIVLCSETDEDIARYSVLHDNNQLFASKYMLYMPTEEELRREIELQKTFYRLQHSEKGIEEE